MSRPIHGIIPAMLTAYDGNEGLDLSRQRALLTRLLSQGVHGLFVCGTTGEFPFLTLAEREQLVELAMAEASGFTPVVVHVGAPNLRDAIRLAQHAAQLGADAICSIPPYYYSYRTAAVCDYLEELASSTDLPFWYYHIPECTRLDLTPQLLDRLLQLTNLTAIKFSDPNFLVLDRARRQSGDRVDFYCGVDGLLLPGLLAGVRGAVGSGYNVLAPLAMKVWEAFSQQRLRAAHAAQEQLSRLVEVLSRFPVIAATKEAASLLGVDVGLPRVPLNRLGANEKEVLAKALVDAKLWDVEGLAPSYC